MVSWLSGCLVVVLAILLLLLRSQFEKQVSIYKPHTDCSSSSSIANTSVCRVGYTPIYYYYSRGLKRKYPYTSLTLTVVVIAVYGSLDHELQVGRNCGPQTKNSPTVLLPLHTP